MNLFACVLKGDYVKLHDEIRYENIRLKQKTD
jgi:hypothetical protein